MSDDVQDIEEQAPPPLSDGVDENSDGAKAGATVLKKESTASAKSKRAILNNEIEILADQPLPQYDNGAAKAYNAQALGSEAKQQIRIFAYVCEKDMIPRARLERKMKGVINPAIAKLIGSGVVYWPPAKAQRFVFIYENNLGKPLMESVDSSNLGWKLDVVMNVADVVLSLMNVD